MVPPSSLPKLILSSFSSVQHVDPVLLRLLLHFRFALHLSTSGSIPSPGLQDSVVV